MQRHTATLQRVLLALLAVSCLSCARPSGDNARESAASAPETLARRLVADMLSLPPDQVVLISVESQDFSDSSLGCPAPGMSYQQVITPGHRVLVEADGRRFDVRVTGEHGKICYRRKPGGRGEPPADPETVSEAVAAADGTRPRLCGEPSDPCAGVWPCATVVRSTCARFFVSAG